MYIMKDGLLVTTKIVTDSTAYIPQAHLDRFGIKVLSLSVSFGDEIFKETEISHKDFFDKLDSNPNFPKSSQPALDETMTLFREILENDHDLIGVFLSSEMSGTYQTSLMIANELKEEFPKRKIEIIDSRSNCMQLGLAVLKGAELLDETFEQIVSKIKHVISHSRFIFMPDTLEYLRRGGRIGSAKALLSSVLQIKPILTVNDGQTDNIMKVRTRKKAIQAMVDLFDKDLENHVLESAYIHHIHCLEDANKLNKKLGKTFEIVPIGPVIGTHVGPGAIGIAYCWE